MSESIAALAAALPQLEAENAKRANYRINRYFPDDGPLSRAHYPKHCQFFALGATHRQRLFLAANRIGKSDTGSYEVTCHLTGRYPPWWTGRRFDGPVRVWAAGDTGKTVRDIIQMALLGPQGAIGTGMIPAHLIVNTTSKSGIADAIETVEVRHVSGGTSILCLKSYDQRREAFQGTSQHVVWLDEEAPEDIVTECLLRTMDTPDLPGGGLLMLTFTPLMGMTPLVLSFLPDGHDAIESDSKAVVTASWDDAPHLSDAAKAELWANIPPYQRDARSKGIPQLGSGAVYQVSEEDIKVADFEVPKHWPRVFGLDAGGGAKPTAAVWGAIDREAQVLYLYSVYKRSAAEPALHIEALKARGVWIPGVGDCAALLMTQHDAEQLIAIYRRAGINVVLPDKSVEAGIQEVWELLSAGKLKVFASCRAWFEEYRLYRRDDKGRIVKQNDHLQDATRYLVRSGRQRAITEPAPEPKEDAPVVMPTPLGWMS